MTTRTLAILFAAGLLGACGSSSGSDLFQNGGSGGGGSGGDGGTGASAAGGSDSGGSSASGGSSGDGGTGNSGGDGGVGGSSTGGAGGSAGTATAGAGGATGGSGGSAGSGGATGGTSGSAGTGGNPTGGTGGSTAGTGGTGGSTAGTGGTGGTGGGVTGDPGSVTCNGSACRVDQGNKCCVPWYGSSPTGSCIDENADCDGNGIQDLKNDITCNGPEDCGAGQHCCGETETIGFGGNQRTVYDSLSCKNSCGNGEVIICGAFPSECGPNQVCAPSSLLESSYNVCRNP